MLLLADARAWSAHPRLGDEIFGPATLAVRCASRPEMLELARGLHGHLTATIHGNDKDLAEWGELVAILRARRRPDRVQRLPDRRRGLPRDAARRALYPATTDSRSTSVGTAAIERFARPVCFQDFPPRALPEELLDANPRGIWRLVDGDPTRDPL